MTAHNDACATDTDVPACSLSPAALDDRIAEWRSLVAHAVKRESGKGWVRATYPNRPEVAQHLAGLIAAEQQCCTFLEFDVHQRDSVLEVELRYPPEFAPLLATARAD